MLFYGLLLVICLIIFILCGKYNNEFLNGEVFGLGCITLFLSIILLFPFGAACITTATANGDYAEAQIRYESLQYKATNTDVRDEFGIYNKKYVDEVQKWNEEIARNQAYRKNIWTKPFAPKFWNKLKPIKLEDVKMRED